MKIKNMQLKNHPVLKNLAVDFLDENEKIENLIVIAGANGSGKTNLLEAIYNYFVSKSEFKRTDDMEIEFTYEEQKVLEKYKFRNKEHDLETMIQHLCNYNYYKNSDLTYDDGSYVKELKNLSKIIYVPTEINFSEIINVDNTYKYEYKFLNKIDNKIINDVPSYLATKVKLVQKENEELTYKEVKEKVSAEINEIFEILELDIKMIGFSSDEKDLPLFSNSYGETFEINKLSSGEKQLFIRALTLKMIEAENAIILIDEPEISLHPKWQQRILKVYENIGKNNQIIIATHSPHILGSVSNEKIRILKKGLSEIEIKRCDELTYGQSLENILENSMELEETIAPDVAKKLKKLHNMINEKKDEEEGFKTLHKELKKILGVHNEELMLLELQLNVVRGKRRS
ncbi:MAG: AAA family ATPase [Fusobacteriaceae bacterium]